MKTMINNEGKKILVTPETFNELQSDYANGVWMAIIYDPTGGSHSVILSQNF